MEHVLNYYIRNISFDKSSIGLGKAFFTRYLKYKNGKVVGYFRFSRAKIYTSLEDDGIAASAELTIIFLNSLWNIQNMEK